MVLQKSLQIMKIWVYDWFIDRLIMFWTIQKNTLEKIHWFTKQFYLRLPGGKQSIKWLRLQLYSRKNRIINKTTIIFTTAK